VTPAAILLYDGRCSLCAGWAARAAAWSGGRVEPRDLRQTDVRALDPRLSPQACEAELHLWEPGGRISAGFAAIRRLAWLSPRLRPALPLLWLPGMGRLGPFLYARLARARFAWSERLRGR
jgi:predicted DCC family thiol-disulfide oxidoreductase YuxK